MTDRLYLATPTEAGHPQRLVIASNPAQVFQHLARTAWTVAPAGAMDVADAMTAGAKPETAGEPVPSDKQSLLPGLND